MDIKQLHLQNRPTTLQSGNIDLKAYITLLSLANKIL